MKKVVAAFDFDGTITYFDSLIPFLVYAMGLRRSLFKLSSTLPRVPGLIRREGSTEAKSQLLSSCLSHLPESRLREIAANFATGQLNWLVRETALDRIRWHQRRGHHCLVVSASIDLYLNIWCKQHGIDTLICSRFDLDTCRLNGPNCKGEEKVRRLSLLYPDRSSYELHAYGDSEGDREILNMADHAYYRRFS